MWQRLAGQRDGPFTLWSANILAGHIRGRPNDLHAKMPCRLESLIHPGHQGRGALRVGHTIVGIPHIDDDNADLRRVGRFLPGHDSVSFTGAQVCRVNSIAEGRRLPRKYRPASRTRDTRSSRRCTAHQSGLRHHKAPTFVNFIVREFLHTLPVRYLDFSRIFTVYFLACGCNLSAPLTERCECAPGLRVSFY